MQWWKVLGLAGVAGVAASGALVLRDERKRRAYSPDEVRSRLHARHAEAGAAPASSAPAGASPAAAPPAQPS